MSEPHDVVKLLVARMESNPEEFTSEEIGRWAQFLDELMPFVTEEERVMLRKPMIQTIHEEVLDELLNGPDKRRKYEEDTEYERHLAAALRQTKHQALMQQAQQYAQAGGASLPVGIGPYQNAVASRQYYDAATDTYNLGNGLKLTSEQVKDNPGLVATMKKALGL